MDRTLDRRRSQRFLLHLDLRCRSFATEENGEGQIVNISSSGILFTSAHEFAIGERVELSICWPVKLDREHPLKLVVLAKVVRREEDRIAVEIARYEFRIEGTLDLTLRKGPTSAVVRAWRAHLRRAGGSS
jgi:hypothetical protein